VKTELQLLIAVLANQIRLAELITAPPGAQIEQRQLIRADTQNIIDYIKSTQR